MSPVKHWYLNSEWRRKGGLNKMESSPVQPLKKKKGVKVFHFDEVKILSVVICASAVILVILLYLLYRRKKKRSLAKQSDEEAGVPKVSPTWSPFMTITTDAITKLNLFQSNYNKKRQNLCLVLKKWGWKTNPSKLGAGQGVILWEWRPLGTL